MKRPGGQFSLWKQIPVYPAGKIQNFCNIKSGASYIKHYTLKY